MSTDTLLTRLERLRAVVDASTPGPLESTVAAAGGWVNPDGSIQQGCIAIHTERGDSDIVQGVALVHPSNTRDAAHIAALDGGPDGVGAALVRVAEAVVAEREARRNLPYAVGSDRHAAEHAITKTREAIDESLEALAIALRRTP